MAESGEMPGALPDASPVLNMNLLTDWQGSVLESQFPTTITNYITPSRLEIEPDVHVQGFSRLTSICSSGKGRGDQRANI